MLVVQRRYCCFVAGRDSAAAGRNVAVACGAMPGEAKSRKRQQALPRCQRRT